MSAWKRATLEELAHFQRGFDISKAEQQPGDVPVVSSSGVTSYHSIAKVKGPGVTIGRKGTLGTVFYIPQDYWPHSTSLWVTDFKGNEPKFVYYYLKILGLEQFDVGASNPTLNRNHIHGLQISIPDVTTQRRIADVLSAYDDLIENNRRRIAILEETARLAYRKWFGGANTARTATLGDLLEVIESGARPKGGAVTDGVPSIGAEKIEAIGIYDFTSEKYISREYYEKMRRGKIRSGDVLLYKDGAYTGKVSMALNGFPHSEAAVNEHVFILRTSDLKTQCYLYCFLRQPEIYEKINTIASAKSCQPGLNQADVLGMEIEVCSEAKIDQFGGVVIDLFGQIVNIAKQSAALAAARDMLLPRLMKGEGA